MSPRTKPPWAPNPLPSLLPRHCANVACLAMGAGMLDGSGRFSGVAAKEMEEETGLVITEESVRVMYM
jgi:hypothetical protein